MKKDKGFTITEVVAVVMIIGLLALIAIPSYTRGRVMARRAQADVILKTIFNGEKQFFFKNARYWGPGGTIPAAQINTALDVNLRQLPDFTYEIQAVAPTFTTYTARARYRGSLTVFYEINETGQLTIPAGG